MARTIADGHLNGNSTKKEKKYTKTGTKDESVVPTQAKNRRLFKIHRICKPCVGSSSIGGTQETQEKNMIYAIAKSLAHNCRGADLEEIIDGWLESRILS